MTREDCVKIIIKVLNCSLNTAEFIMEGIDPYVSELQKENEELKATIKSQYDINFEECRKLHQRIKELKNQSTAEFIMEKSNKIFIDNEKTT
jgi:hypothetical protein